ncbi:MAG: DNA primase [Candidatus Doudnabacteria bacterium]|nr:DNA primase [Candidatus Doudnabacteria bacterium]
MDNPALQEIKDRLNIVDVISGYIPVKKAGVNFKAACPFHHEKTPSLIISSQKQIWHCFGCGEGGDVFGFVSKYENLDFKETLKLLADKAGVKLPEYRPQDKALVDEKELLSRINNFAARYYHEVLTASPAGKEALDYLHARGLNDITIKNWQIGFAPDEFHFLEKALLKKNVALNDLVKAGVSAKNERGQIYDRFRGRITFPIFNYFGEVVGFTARILHNESNGAKYINSPETAIYNKSKTLFALNFAKEAIRKKDEVVIVEGQMDCISSHQAGFNNAVASSGTALTEVALQQLGRLTKNLKFCFDADTAGQTASRRAGEAALKMGFRLKLIVLKNVKDPDELIKRSPGLWEKAISEAVWFLDYYIDLAAEKFKDGSVEQKLYLSKEVVPFLTYISDPLEQDHYVHKISNRFQISEKIIREQIKKERSPAPVAASGKVGPGMPLQKEVLGGLLFNPEFFNLYAPQVKAEDFEDPYISKLAAGLLSSGGQDIQVKSDTVAKEALFMVESQLDDLAGDTEKLNNQLKKTFSLFKLNSFKRQLQNLQAELKTAELAGNKPKIEELNKRVAEILNLRIVFEQNLNS